MCVSHNLFVGLIIQKKLLICLTLIEKIFATLPNLANKSQFLVLDSDLAWPLFTVTLKSPHILTEALSLF